MPKKQATPPPRKRRTKSQIEQLERQIFEILESDNPQSVRHVFYRLTDPRLPESIAKTEHGYAQVQKRLTSMRKAGLIPYGWISDATRRGYHVPTFAGPADFVRRVAGQYRAQVWPDTPYHVEVWTESRSIAGVVQDVCREAAVSLYPAGGFSSLSLVYEAAEHIRRIADGREIIVLYCGDYDAAGLLIDRDICNKYEAHGVALTFRRLAVNAEQIARYDLPTKPRKASEKRRPDILETVECEALPAAELRRILRQTIEEYVPAQALAAIRAAEESERESLRIFADQLDAA